MVSTLILARMHSSRVRTIHSFTVFPGSLPSGRPPFQVGGGGGCLLSWDHDGICLLWGVCLPGVWGEVCFPVGCLSSWRSVFLPRHTPHTSLPRQIPLPRCWTEMFLTAVFFVIKFNEFTNNILSKSSINCG